MPHYDPIIGLPDFKVISISESKGIELVVEYLGRVACPHCDSQCLRKKDSFDRHLKHTCIGLQRSKLVLRAHKFKCRGCGRYFNQRFPGIKLRFRGTEPFREEVAIKHRQGFSKSCSADVFDISPSTVERCFRGYLRLKDSHRSNADCPRILGIDEKFFTKKKGFMTTLCDLKKRKVFELMLGRSELSLKDKLKKIPERDRCRVVLMDLSETFRSIAKTYFPNAMIVADRFHVVKLVNLQFLRTWGELDEAGRKSRGLLSLMRRHPENLKPEQQVRLRKYLDERPAIAALYDFKQHLMALVLARVSNRNQAKRLIPHFINAIEILKESGFKHMKTLGETIEKWQEEIVRMWRFSKTNGITEGFHNKMEEILRRAYGMRNFENFRLHVLETCT